MPEKSIFLVKRRKFLTIGFGTSIGFAIPYLIHPYNEQGNSDKAKANPCTSAACIVFLSGTAGDVVITLWNNREKIRRITGVLLDTFEKILIEVQKEINSTSNIENSKIAIEEKLTKINKTLIASYKDWDIDKARFEINGRLGLKINKASSKLKVPFWAMNQYYGVGDIVAYEGIKYSCIQAHTSYAPNWMPSIHTSALWKRL